MTPSEINELVDLSLSGPRTVYTAHSKSPDAFVAELMASFVASRIEPRAIEVHLERYVPGLIVKPGPHEVYLVNDAQLVGGTQSVFFDPKTSSFVVRGVRSYQMGNTLTLDIVILTFLPFLLRDTERLSMGMPNHSLQPTPAGAAELKR